jgi:hypothetical protein
MFTALGCSSTSASVSYDTATEAYDKPDEPRYVVPRVGNLKKENQNLITF